MPSDVLDVDRMRKQGTKLHVENLPMQQLDSDAYLRGIPSSVLASIKVVGPAAPLTGQLPALKELILNSRNLEVLSFQDKGLGTQLRFGPGERMPPLTELSLRSYDWNHSEREVREHWDFSRLQSLELMSVPYYNFLSSVPRGSLSNLRSLQLEDWSAHLEDRRLEATGLLYDLLRHQIKSLTSLGVSCHVQRLPLDAILKHRNLEELRLRDHVGFAAEHLRCPTLEPRDLAALGRNLVRLCSLEIDMDHRVCSPEDFLRALMHFPRLDRLTLHVQTTVRTNDEADDDYYDRVAQEDRDHDAAMHIFSLLTSGRAQTNPDLLWKHITINVGGWRRIMVRRLGSAWRALNERGVFAERCFVMKRTNGQYGTHEISCDVPSSRPTPGSRALSPAVYEIR